MKKYIITLGLVFGTLGCSDEYYDSLNVDQSNPSDVPASFLVTNSTTSLFNQMNSINVNINVFQFFAQYLTTTTYLDEPNYDLETRNVNGNHWNRLYTRVLYNLKDAKLKVEADTSISSQVKANQLAIIDILEVYTWQVLVDTFGNVPYTEALGGIENQFPKYDDAATIYSDLISRITHDIQTITISESGFGNDDIIYGDDMSKWKKTAASLKLRLGVQISDVNNTLATSTIADALAAGVYASNDDNFKLNYLGAAPNNNPLYNELVLSGRLDYLPANTTVDYMNNLDDPRRPIYFDQNMGAGVYSGGVYGASNPYVNFSHLGPVFYEPTIPGVLLDYAEVKFLLAEAAAKGYSVGGTTEFHYNEGVIASMEYWGVDAGDAAAYLASPNVAFGTAPGSAKEKVAKQFWLAMFNRGFEGWNVWRRLDAPVLNVADFSQLPVPTRYTYPLTEATLNPTSYNEAASAIGGDTPQTKLFWDVN